MINTGQSFREAHSCFPISLKLFSVTVLAIVFASLAGCAGKTGSGATTQLSKPAKSRALSQRDKDFLAYLLHISAPAMNKVCVKILSMSEEKLNGLHKKWAAKRTRAIKSGRAQVIQARKKKNKGTIEDYENGVYKSIIKRFKTRNLKRQKKQCLGHLFSMTL